MRSGGRGRTARGPVHLSQQRRLLGEVATAKAAAGTSRATGGERCEEELQHAAETVARMTHRQTIPHSGDRRRKTAANIGLIAPSGRARSRRARPPRRRAARRRGTRASQAQPTSAPTTGSSIATIPTRVARRVPQRADEQEERDDRPEHDHPGGERPDRQVHATARWPQQRRVARQRVRRERPPRDEHRPEDRREEEAPREQRDRVAPADDVLGEQDVERVGERAGEREQHAGGRERRAAAEEVRRSARARPARARARPRSAAAPARGRRSAPRARRAAARGTRSGARCRSRAGGSRGSRTTARTRARRPEDERYGSSRRVSRSRRARSARRSRASRRAAPSERTCASRSDESPVARIVFETAPLTPQRSRGGRGHQRSRAAGARMRRAQPGTGLRSWPREPTLCAWSGSGMSASSSRAAASTV